MSGIHRPSASDEQRLPDPAPSTGPPLGGLETLSYARAAFRLRVERDGALNPFLGSALRGAIGHSLRKIACLPLCRDVDTCILRDRCAYAYLFETPVPQGAARLRNMERLPHPFLVEPPPARSEPWRKGEELRFHVLLVGRAVDHFPFLVAAVHRLASEGLGSGRLPLSLAGVDEAPEKGRGRNLWPGENDAIERLEAQNFAPPPSPFREGTVPRLSVRFVTPVRLVADGKVTSELTFRRLARSVIARLSSLLYFHCGRELDVDFKGRLDAAGDVRLASANLAVESLARWSNRQQSRLQLDGLTGEVVFEGEPLREWWPFLAAGRIVHAGKGTVFGLGRYEISPSE